MLVNPDFRQAFCAARKTMPYVKRLSVEPREMTAPGEIAWVRGRGHYDVAVPAGQVGHSLLHFLDDMQEQRLSYGYA